MKKHSLFVNQNLHCFNRFFVFFAVVILLFNFTLWGESAETSSDSKLESQSFFQTDEPLSDYLEANLLRLDGKWELYLEKTPEQVFRLIDENTPSDYMAQVPGVWNEEVIHSGGTSPNTYGCYRAVVTDLEPNTKYAFLAMESPGTSCAVYINRRFVAQTGDPFEMVKPGFNEKPNAYNPSHSESKPFYCEFTSDKDGCVDILFFISNYFYRKGGLWDSVFFGTPENVTSLNTIAVVFYSIIIGCLFFIGLLNLIQFFINKNKAEYFYLGIMSIIFALRIGTADFCSLAFLFPHMSAEIKIKIEYLVIWLAPISIIQMVFTIYPSKERFIIFKWLKERHLRHFIIICDLILGILSLVLPAYYSSRLVPYLQWGLCVISVYVILFIVLNLIKRKKYSLYNLLSYSMLFLGGVIDIIYSKHKDYLPISFFPFFLVVFVIIQLIMLATIQNDIYKETIKTSGELQRLNEAYLRFVPQEFLTLLNKESIIKTKLGDFSNIEMVIMFAKVHIECDDDDVSLNMHFQIFNEYLKQVSTIIKKYNGFVSKFLSGGFMALFPKSELDAVLTALEIDECIKKLSGTEVFYNHKVSTYIGIHYGKMIIGTIGEENRLDDTVISDTVNTAARIESVCERLGKNVIASHSLEKLLLEQKDLLADRPINIKFRELEAMYVKGKEKPLQLYEVTMESETRNEMEDETVQELPV